MVGMACRGPYVKVFLPTIKRGTRCGYGDKSIQSKLVVRGEGGTGRVRGRDYCLADKDREIERGRGERAEI